MTHSVNFKLTTFGGLDPLSQTCQTQTSFRAAKATKIAEGAAKVPKNPSVGHI